MTPADPGNDLALIEGAVLIEIRFSFGRVGHLFDCEAGDQTIEISISRSFDVRTCGQFVDTTPTAHAGHP